MKETFTHRPAFIEKEAMQERGYEQTNDRDGYLEYQSIGGKAIKRKGRAFEQALGNKQRVININTKSYDEGVFYLGIRCDGNTRTIFSGSCDTEEFFNRLLEMCD